MGFSELVQVLNWIGNEVLSLYVVKFIEKKQFNI